ncbi:MAG: CPBP family intramembrane glutamic endopeptidase [Pseudomonadota bacterium]
MQSLRGSRLIWLHLYPGLILVALFAALAPLAQLAGIPTFGVLLLLEVFVLAPFVWFKLRRVARQEGQPARVTAALGFAPPANWRSYLWLVPLGLILAILSFELLRPIDDMLRAAMRDVLPGWHYSVDMERHPRELLLAFFLFAILADGLIGPAAEELYFRGYLLPRMAHLGRLAPLINGLLFAIYHFWQPMNYPSLWAASCVFAYFAWLRGDYRVALGIHIAMNTLGHVLGVIGLLAVE